MPARRVLCGVGDAPGVTDVITPRSISIATSATARSPPSHASSQCSNCTSAPDACDELGDPLDERVAMEAFELLPRRQRVAVVHAVQEQHAVEMVEFVLERAGSE